MPQHVILDANVLLKLLSVSDFADGQIPDSLSPDAPPAMAIPHDGGLADRRFRAVQEHDALFRNFSEATNPSEVAAFFARYAGSGNLSGVHHLVLRLPNAVFHSHSLQVVPADGGGCSSSWVDHALAMNRCVHLWDLVRAGDEKSLAQYIRWVSDQNGVGVWFHPTGTETSGVQGDDTPIVIASRSVRPKVLEQFKPGSTVKPALFFIQQVINERLARTIEARLLWSDQSRSMSLHFVPCDLLGGLWLQFALAFAGNKDVGRCPECGEWFEVSLEGARKSRRYCSDNCRVKAYQGRRDMAARLKAKGKSIREITRELGSRVESVKQWLKLNREKSGVKKLKAKKKKGK
jgi:hypothetical protein